MGDASIIVSELARRHIVRVYPELGSLLNQLEPLAALRCIDMDVPEAITRIVIGQMLSAKAAAAIRARVYASAERQGKLVWELDTRSLRRCGLSGRKVLAIREFRRAFLRDPARYHRWREHSYDTLRAEVASHRGLSDWSAAMLGIFYLGHEDVFPTTDGTIRRAIKRLVASGVLVDEDFDAGMASPYRSFLARYFWRAIDDKLL